MKRLTTYILGFYFLIVSFSALAQTLSTPKFVPDGAITKMEYTPNFGLLVAGDFHYWGFPAKNVAIVDNNVANPSGSFPFLTVTNNVQDREVVPDGTGGWYVVTCRQLYSNGQFKDRPQQIWSDSTARIRTFDCITHLKSDNSIDTVFRINTNTSTYRIIGLQSVVFYKSTLYAWCDLADESGSFYRRKLLGINARTGAVEWDPNTNHRIDVITGGLMVLGRNLFVVGQMNVVNGQPTTRYSLSYNLDNRQVRAWNPLNNSSFGCDGCGAKITGFGNKLVITVTPTTALKELIATDTVTTTLWRKQTQGYSHLAINPTIDATVGYYLAATSFTCSFIKFRLSDGQTIRSQDYPVFSQDADTNSLYVGNVKGLALQGRHLYVYGNVADGRSRRRVAIQVDTASFKPTNWKPFNERENGEVDYSTNYRYIEALAFQGSKVFMAGNFNLIKLRFAPGLAAIDPIANTLRWKPNVNFRDVNYLQTIGAIAAEGDSLVWVVQDNYMIRAFDGRTGFRVKEINLFDASYRPTIKQIIPTADRLYLQGFFYRIAGITVANGFAAITKNGATHVWDPIFDNSTGGQINKISLQGDNVYLGGRFTAKNGSQNLAIVNRFTGKLTNWKAEMPNKSLGYPYEVKNFLVQGGELFTVNQDAGLNMPGEYRRVSLTSGKVIGNYLFSTCQAADQLLAKGKYVFINEKYCTPYTRESLSYFDQTAKKFINKPLLNPLNFQFPNETRQDYFADPLDMQFIGNKLYYASNYNNGNTTVPIPRLMTMEFPKEFFAETIDYFPHSGGNNGTVTVNFYSPKLVVGSRVKLIRTGQTPINVADTEISFPEPFRMEATFNLRNKAVGPWDIIISDPSGQNITISGGFVINQAKPASIQLMVTTPGAYRTGAPTKVVVSVTNAGDKDAYAVPIYIITSVGTKVNVLTRTVIDNVSYYADSAFQFDVTERGFLENGMWLQIPKISSGQIFTIPITLTDYTGRDITIRAYNARLLTDFIPDGNTNGSMRLVTNLQTLADPFNDIDPDRYDTGKLLKPAIDCAFDGISDNTKTPIDNIILDGIRGKIVPSDIGTMLKNTYFPEEPRLPRRWIPPLLDLGKQLDNAVDPKLPPSCDPFRPEKKFPAEGTISSVRSGDPNDKIGPTGVKKVRFVSGREQFSYLIRFENYANATAAAQFVKILDTLDRNKFDYSTFQLGYFNVADTTFHIPPGRKQYSLDWDMRPAKDLVLRMEAQFNETTGILSSTYTALDPVTMDLTEDVFAGFLPPNKKAPQGEGGLAYSIRVKESLPHLTTVTNTAMIYFDYNPPVPTPPWTNTLDKTAPTSQVLPLPSTTQSTTLVVKWSGSDTGSGPKYYDIFKAVNNGSYQSLLSNTKLTQLEFVGKIDSTYKFYSVAIDSVGNQEAIPSTFDTQTKIVGCSTLPTVSIVGSGTISCSQPSRTLTANTNAGSPKYQWSTGATTNAISITATGTYSVTVTATATGCSNVASTTITGSTTPIISINSATITSGQSSTIATTGCSGTVKWNTGASGTHLVVQPMVTTSYSSTCTVSGGCSSTAVGTVTVNNPSINQPPQAPTVVPLSATVNSAFSATLPSFTDPENGTLTYGLTGLPNGMGFAAATRIISGIPTAAGSFTLIYSASDNKAAKTNVSVLLTVVSATITPVPGNFEGYLDKVECGTIRGWAWDKNKPNTPLALEFLDGPSIATAVVIGTTNADIYRSDLQAAGKGNGAHAYSFTVPESLKNGQSRTIWGRVTGSTFVLTGSPKTLTCQGSGTPVNQPPVAPATAPLSATIGKAYSATLPTFTDPENSTLSYGLSGLPAGLSFASSTRIISGTPTVSGSFTLAYSATDNQSAKTQVAITMTVSATAATNQPPKAPTTSPLSATIGTAFSVTLPTFTDPENKPLTHSLSSLPSGLNFTANSRIISGSAASGTTGIYALTYSATDGQATTSTSITLTVIDKATPPTSVTGNFDGYLTTVSCGEFRGWIWDSKLPNTPIMVEFFSDGVSIGAIEAKNFRQDLKDAGKGNGNHGYIFTTPSKVKDNINHQISAKVQNSTYTLKGSPIALKCAVPSGRVPDTLTDQKFEVLVIGNPVSHQVQVEVRGAEGQPLRLQLTDASGRLVSQHQIEAAKAVEHQTLSVNQQPVGLLLLRVSSGLNSVTLKVVKQ
jgi:hypothetical protein